MKPLLVLLIGLIPINALSQNKPTYKEPLHPQFQPGQIPMVAIYTAHIIPDKSKPDDYLQNQHIAYSLDDGRTWEKYDGNPVPDLNNYGAGEVTFPARGQVIELDADLIPAQNAACGIRLAVVLSEKGTTRVPAAKVWPLESAWK